MRLLAGPVWPTRAVRAAAPFVMPAALGAARFAGRFVERQLDRTVLGRIRRSL